ncbi:hypothetical protein [Streptomyces sp. NPDC046161]|uniref:hypothetical protein n=1 Tax=Streptomyces sp. NPDC046161 TaxID=3155132 RepID=UPI0033D3A5FC
MRRPARQLTRRPADRSSRMRAAAHSSRPSVRTASSAERWAAQASGPSVRSACSGISSSYVPGSTTMTTASRVSRAALSQAEGKGVGSLGTTKVQVPVPVSARA